MPVSYLPAAAARGCIETESKGRVGKGMDRGEKKVCARSARLGSFTGGVHKKQ